MIHKKSQSLFERAQQHIPGGVNSPVRAFKRWWHSGFYQEGEGRLLI